MARPGTRTPAGPAPVAAPGTARLAEARRLLLTTFSGGAGLRRRCCLVVADGAALGVLVETDGPALADIGRYPGVLVGPCDAHGRPTGPQVPATATRRDPGGTAQYRGDVINKYGFGGITALARARWRHGARGTVGLRLALLRPDSPVAQVPWHPDWPYSPN